MDPERAFLQGCKSQGRKQRLVVGLCAVHAPLLGRCRADGVVYPTSPAQHRNIEASTRFLLTTSERKQQASGTVSQAGGLGKLVNLDGS